MSHSFRIFLGTITDEADIAGLECVGWNKGGSTWPCKVQVRGMAVKVACTRSLAVNELTIRLCTTTCASQHIFLSLDSFHFITFVCLLLCVHCRAVGMRGMHTEVRGQLRLRITSFRPERSQYIVVNHMAWQGAEKSHTAARGRCDLPLSQASMACTCAFLLCVCPAAGSSTRGSASQSHGCRQLHLIVNSRCPANNIIAHRCASHRLAV